MVHRVNLKADCFADRSRLAKLSLKLGNFFEYFIHFLSNQRNHVRLILVWMIHTNYMFSNKSGKDIYSHIFYNS